MSDPVKVSKEVEVGRDAGKSLAPVNVCGDDGTGVWIYVYWVKSVELEQTHYERMKRKTHPALKERGKY